MRDEFVSSSFYIECDEAGYRSLSELKKELAEKKPEYRDYSIYYNPDNMTAYLAFTGDMYNGWEDDFEAFAAELSKQDMFIEGFCVSDYEASLSRGELVDGKLDWVDVTQFLTIPNDKLKQFLKEAYIDDREESDSLFL